MKLRVARHTTAIQPILHFYQEVLGLDLLGEFQSHDNYDGCFLGKEGLGWHLEFTVSNEQPNHHPDEDDLLVFYVASEEVYQEYIHKFEMHNIDPVSPRNPYWEKKGKTFADPDGFRIVISVMKS